MDGFKSRTIRLASIVCLVTIAGSADLLSQDAYYLKDDIQYQKTEAKSPEIKDIDMTSPIEKLLDDKTDTFHKFDSKKQIDKSTTIVFETRFVTVDPQHAEQLHKYFTIGTIEIVKPSVPVMPTNVQRASEGLVPEPQSLSTTTKAQPSVFGLVSPAKLKSIFQDSKGNTGINITQAPTITTFDQQIASVCNFSKRPFVVGMKPPTDNEKMADQPVIQIHDDGIACKLSGNIEGNIVDLRVSCFQSEITDVQTYTFNAGVGTDPKIVQVPVVKIDQFRAAKKVKVGQTLMIDFTDRAVKKRAEKSPAWVHPLIAKNAFVGKFIPKVNNEKIERQRVFMLVTPRIISTKK